MLNHSTLRLAKWFHGYWFGSDYVSNVSEGRLVQFIEMNTFLVNGSAAELQPTDRFNF